MLPIAPLQPTCSAREEFVNGQCVPKCRPDERRVNGQCVGGNLGNNGNLKPLLPKNGNPGIVPLNQTTCSGDQEMVHGRCVPRCAAEQFRARSGQCARKQ